MALERLRRSSSTLPGDLSSMYSSAPHRDAASSFNIYMPSLSHLSGRSQNGDRFIPNRSAMDLDLARSQLTGPRKRKEEWDAASPYRSILAKVLFGDRTRILSFKNPLCSPARGVFDEVLSSPPIHLGKKQRYIPQNPEKILDALDVMEDYLLNLLDWGSKNVVAIALGYTVYLWDADSKSNVELTTVDEDTGPVTSVNWAPDGQHLAVGLNSSEIQLWDLSSYILYTPAIDIWSIGCIFA